MNADSLIEISDLKIYFKTLNGVSKAVNGINLQIYRGEVLGLVGESGSGKSVTGLSLMGLIPKPEGYIASGDILLEGKSILQFSETELNTLRGGRIGMIFQEPMTSLNPVFRVGEQIGEALEIHRGLKGRENKKTVLELLQKVRIPDGENIYSAYPHQLSGGMRQRVMIAMALSCQPDLLIADEPTTALDVTIQAQILDLLQDLVKENNISILFITHDLSVISEIADRVAVMYAGKVVECADKTSLLCHPKHPYTRGLIKARPENYSIHGGYYAIPGVVPSAMNRPAGCQFAPRCQKASAVCSEKEPPLTLAGNRAVACWNLDPEASHA
ncbi:MAG: ABC transporter ATP-binding protein [Anaerolineaceae bacterium]|nr:ABC transporter ATP-binding protein [Anaerolineaceae bacterium]